MKLLAAAEGAGPGPDGFAWSIPGELVFTADVHEDLRQHCMCGCVISFIGMTSGLATTTAVVVDLDLTREQLEAIARDHLTAPDEDEDPEWIAEFVADLLDAADPFPAGTLVRRHLDRIEAL
jgi:hypothetical protein